VNDSPTRTLFVNTRVVIAIAFGLAAALSFWFSDLGHLRSRLSGRAPTLGYRIVEVAPHDPTRFTQGLAVDGDFLFESSGRYGQSAVVAERSGKVEQRRELPPELFAEGLTLIGDRIVLLTWREGLGIVLSRTLELLGTFPLQSEGWGVATLQTDNRGEVLVMSDGTSLLRVLDGRDYSVIRRIQVRDHGRAVPLLNELEVANGLIYANVYTTDKVAIINPANGDVVAWLDLSALRASLPYVDNWDAAENVLNGIAYLKGPAEFLVTGKLWPLQFRIQISEVPRIDQ